MHNFRLVVVPLLLCTGRNFAFLIASKHAIDQNFLWIPLDANFVRVASNIVPNLRSTMEFCCELFDAVQVAFVRFYCSASSSAFVLCSFELLKWYRFIDVPTASSSLRIPLMIIPSASLFFLMGNSVYARKPSLPRVGDKRCRCDRLPTGRKPFVEVQEKQEEPPDAVLNDNTRPITPLVWRRTNLIKEVEPLDAVLTDKTGPTTPVVLPTGCKTFVEVHDKQVEPVKAVLTDITEPITPVMQRITNWIKQVEPLDAVLTDTTGPINPVVW